MKFNDKYILEKSFNFIASVSLFKIGLLGSGPEFVGPEAYTMWFLLEEKYSNNLKITETKLV
jgi:hypothetical protein